MRFFFLIIFDMSMPYSNEAKYTYTQLYNRNNSDPFPRTHMQGQLEQLPFSNETSRN